MLRFTCCSSSSKVVSGALRAIASSTILSGPTVDAFAASHHQLHQHARKAPNFVSRYFSTDANISIHRNLVKALKSDIKSRKHNLSLHLHPPQLPDDFPFTILEGDDYFCKLTRELNGEKIFVSITMPKIIQEELRIAAAADDPSVCLPEPIGLHVGIGIKNGKSLGFLVYICPRVLHVAMMETQSDRRRLRCCVEREGKLQTTLQEYLEMRGIKTCYAEFMYRYMVWKSKRATLVMLQEFEKFIEDP